MSYKICPVCDERIEEDETTDYYWVRGRLVCSEDCVDKAEKFDDINSTPTPECDKLSKVKDKSQIIGEFLEWLICGNTPYMVCEEDRFEDFHPMKLSINGLLAEYFNVDLDKVEAEKQEILNKIRALNDQISQGENR